MAGEAVGRAAAGRRATSPIVVVLAVLGIVVGCGLGTASPAAPSSQVPTSVPCPGAHGAHIYTGSLAVDGGPGPPSLAAGVNLEMNYFVEDKITGPSDPQGYLRCLPMSGTVATLANGSFVYTPAIPGASCRETPEGEECTQAQGPYDPVALTTLLPPPTGYSLSVDAHAASFDLAFVWELGTVTLAPAASQVTVAPDAPTTFAATGWAANGSETRLDPQFNWTLNGTGWSFAEDPSGPIVAVVAQPGAELGALTVRASASVGAIHLTPAPVSVALSAVATTLGNGELNRTGVDAGSSIALNLSGFGAVGYAYTARISPGLGLTGLTIPCATTPGPPGTVDFSCRSNLTYPRAGVAQPTAAVTNGYSAATWLFPDVTVAPLPALSVDPHLPVGYAGGPLPITIAPAPGAGAEPYAGACLRPGVGPSECVAGSGPSWVFAPTYPAPGNYTAIASATDGDGTNASVSFPVRVVGTFSLGPLVGGPANATVDSPVSFSTQVIGGDLPARFWWNASSAAGPVLSGSVASDGTIALTFVPTVVGSMVLTLTVVDGLGTVRTATRLVHVGPSAATEVVAVTLPPASAVGVGERVTLTWGAFDADGSLVRSYAAPSELVLTDPGSVSAQVDLSGVGPVAPIAPGTFRIPVAAWVGGLLNVSIEPVAEGELSVALTPSGLPPLAPIAFGVVPDLRHLILSQPVVEARSARAGSTFWRVTDRFGNPAPGAALTVEVTVGGATTQAIVVAARDPNGTSGAWINYSAPGSSAGTVTVLDAAGDVVLGPIEIPTAGDRTAPGLDLVAVAATGGVGGLVGAAIVVSRRRTRPGGAAAPPTDEEALRRLAEGRATIVEIVERTGGADLSEIEREWVPAPAPPEMAEWLASLVADGTLGAIVGPDGRPRFALAGSTAAAPRVSVDPAAVDEAIRRRASILAPEAPDDPDEGPAPGPKG